MEKIADRSEATTEQEPIASTSGSTGGARSDVSSKNVSDQKFVLDSDPFEDRPDTEFGKRYLLITREGLQMSGLLKKFWQFGASAALHFEQYEMQGQAYWVIPVSYRRASFKVLTKIVQWCEHHRDDVCWLDSVEPRLDQIDVDEYSLEQMRLDERASVWDTEFFDQLLPNHMETENPDDRLLFWDLIRTAHYLNIESLVDAYTRYIGSQLKATNNNILDYFFETEYRVEHLVDLTIIEEKQIIDELRKRTLEPWSFRKFWPGLTR